METTDTLLVEKVSSLLRGKTISAEMAEVMMSEIKARMDETLDTIRTAEPGDRSKEAGRRLPEADAWMHIDDTSPWKPDIVIYHDNCADGFGAAWACWRRWGAQCEYIPASYGASPPDVAGKHVLIVDFSYKRAILEEMGATAASIIILDHHETAEEDLGAFRRCADKPERFTVAATASMNADLRRNGYLPISAQFDMKRSGARMAWDFCHPGIEAPLLLRLVEDRDLWLFEFDTSRPFALWLRSEPFDFERWSEIAHDIEGRAGAHILREAEAMQRFYDEKVKEMASFARRRVFDGFLPIVVNCPPMFASDVGNYLLQAHPDAPFAATFFDAGDKRMWSLRSMADREAVSTIAAAHGGGGHRNAAGFAETLEDLLLWPVD